MKGRKLKTDELKNNQLVFLEFDFNSITQCESDQEFEKKLNQLRESYKDGLYKVNLKDETFISVVDDTELGFNHNLISNIYEWIKCVCQELKNDQFKQIAHGDYNDLYISKDHDEYFIEAIADGKASIKMKYCPFCGGKLGED